MSAARNTGHIFGDLAYSDRALAPGGRPSSVHAPNSYGQVDRDDFGVGRSGKSAACKKPGVGNYRVKAAIAGRAIATAGVISWLYLIMLHEIVSALGPVIAGLLIFALLGFVCYLAYTPWAAIRDANARYAEVVKELTAEKAQHGAALLREYKQGLKDGRSRPVDDDERTPSGGTRIRQEGGS